MKKSFTSGTSILTAILIGACTPAPSGQGPEETAPESGTTVLGENASAGFFSVAQADRGRGTFGLVCSECHDTSDFQGDDFEWEWRRRTVWDFFRQLRETMPEDNPGSLPPDAYADVIAYILQLNEYAAGEAELMAEQEPMDKIPLGPNVNKTGRSGSAGNDG